MDKATREEIARAMWESSPATAPWHDALPGWRAQYFVYATAIEPIIARLIAEARVKALEEAAELVSEGARAMTYSERPSAEGAGHELTKRAAAIRGLKTKDAANG